MLAINLITSSLRKKDSHCSGITAQFGNILVHRPGHILILYAYTAPCISKRVANILDLSFFLLKLTSSYTSFRVFQSKMIKHLSGVKSTVFCFSDIAKISSTLFIKYIRTDVDAVGLVKHILGIINMITLQKLHELPNPASMPPTICLLDFVVLVRPGKISYPSSTLILSMCVSSFPDHLHFKTQQRLSRSRVIRQRVHSQPLGFLSSTHVPRRTSWTHFRERLLSGRRAYLNRLRGQRYCKECCCVDRTKLKADSGRPKSPH